VRAQRDGQYAAISVQDQGIGIAPDMLPRIFEMFLQGESGAQRSQGGLGIGLSLARQLVQLHGGTLEGRSEGPGKGSEFIVRLPLARGARPEDAEPTTTAPARRTRRRVLVVDDWQDSADSLASLLRVLGHEVHTAYDGEAALAVAEQLRPEVVLLDIGMPKMSGYEACRRIRMQPWGRDVYLIALTGWGQPDDRRRSVQAGFDHHLVKPIEPEPLDALLASLPRGD
jgi:CheY-like chemotaxis protein